ncbi:MAG: flavin reductase family protein [Clostridiales bacterium]|nr:flavin reductase family protein [Clostridiales bacterium]
MAKQQWKPGNMLYPLPAVMVSVRDKQGNDNIITVAWAGTVCTNPPMVSISVRPERHSYHMIEESGEFVINLTTEKLCFATDYCGVRSGRDVDKFAEMKLTKVEASQVNVPMIGESPVNIECKLKKIEKLGSHHMFVAEVVAVHAEESYMDEKNRFDLNKAQPMVYSHGEYFSLGKKLGTFGYSVKKKKKMKDKGRKIS